MGSIIAWLIAKGIPANLARPLAIGALVLAVFGLLYGAKCSYDRKLIGAHDAKQTAATAVADRKADTKAADQRRVDDARITQETAQLEKVQANAPTDTARRLARHRCLRAQQSARASGKPSPTC